MLIIETIHGDFQCNAYFNDPEDHGIEVHMFTNVLRKNKDKTYIGTLPNHYEDFDNMSEQDLQSLENEVIELYESTF